MKNYPNKPENKNFVVQLGGRQCDGKKFKQTMNYYFFYPVDGTFFSFKDPQRNVHSVSKFCFIRLYLRILKNNKKHTVLELKSKFLFSVYAIFNNVTQT